MEGHAGSLLRWRPQLDPERLRGRTAARPSGVEQRAAGVALAPVDRERPGQRARAARRPSPGTPSRAVSRASTIGGPVAKFATGALVGQSSAAQTHSAPHVPGAVVERAVRASSRRRTCRRAARPGTARMPSPRLALGAADDAGRERVGRAPVLAPGAARPRRRRRGATASGTSMPQLVGLALRDQRVAVAQLDPLAVADDVERALERRRRAQRDGRLLGADQLRHDPARCSRRWPTPAGR